MLISKLSIACVPESAWKATMPINVTCHACNQVVAAPDAMAGKKAVCPNCRAVIAIPEEFAPAAIADPTPHDKSSPEPPSDHEIPTSLDITSPRDAQAEEEKAALRILGMVYVFCRDDWRRLPTCAHLWFALFLFFLPWINISCNGRTLVTQTGLQTCHGAFSVDPKFEKMARHDPGLRNENILKPKPDETPPWSVLSIIYVTFVFLGALIGFPCIAFVVFRLHTFAAATHLFSLGLGGAAFLALGSQMLIGFPIERHMTQQIEKNRAEQERRNAQFGIRPMPNDGMDAWFDVEARYSAWLWLSFVISLVSVPIFLLEFVILIAEAVKKHMRQRSDSG
jgi:hypothetical protein